MSELDEILKSIGIKESRESTKDLIRGFKHDEMTRHEVEALYMGISMTDETYRPLLPLTFLWIEEVWSEDEEEKKDEIS